MLPFLLFEVFGFVVFDESEMKRLPHQKVDPQFPTKKILNVERFHRFNLLID